MSLTFTQEGHRYELDSKPVRSVTQILKKVGLINFDRIPPSILEAARQRGTIVHRAIHFANENDLDVFRFASEFPAYSGYLQSWLRLLKSGRLVTRFCEHRVACRSPRFSGTFDWLGLFDGQAAILDFATGDPNDAAKHLQTCAYVLAARAWKTEPGEEPLRAFLDQYGHVRRYSVRLHKLGGLPIVTPYTDAKDFSKFIRIAETVNIVDEEKPKSSEWQWAEEAA
jgi:hypothetical protein